jgi:hypothetical protein
MNIVYVATFIVLALYTAICVYALNRFRRYYVGVAALVAASDMIAVAAAVNLFFGRSALSIGLHIAFAAVGAAIFYLHWPHYPATKDRQQCNWLILGMALFGFSIIP